jgi:hypothetical protein
VATVTEDIANADRFLGEDSLFVCATSNLERRKPRGAGLTWTQLLPAKLAVARIPGLIRCPGLSTSTLTRNEFPVVASIRVDKNDFAGDFSIANERKTHRHTLIQTHRFQELLIGGKLHEDLIDIHQIDQLLDASTLSPAPLYFFTTIRR